MTDMSRARTNEIVPPVRTEKVALPQCRCVILNGDGTQGDRCRAFVSDPDSPLCVECHTQKHPEQDRFAMVDLIIR